MATQSFKDLIVWQRASELSLGVYKSVKDLNDYSFRDQIQRAALSVPNNIAEGYARRSDKAFKNFLFIAKGSVAEVESMLLIAEKLDYISQEKQSELIFKADEVSKLLSGFIKKLSAKDS
jgi:four helix bundle protein